MLVVAVVPGPAAAADRDIIIALVGDSTVTNHAGWGGAFAARFNERARVLNFAVSGHSARSWYAEDRLAAVLEARPDFALVQFGHNDMRSDDAGGGSDPTAAYRDYLERYVTAFRDAGATPIVVSPVARRTFAPQGRIESELAPWAAAAGAVARQTGALFVDLHAASVALYNDMGPKASMVFNPREGDLTHFNRRGAEAITDLVLDRLVRIAGKLSGYLK